MCLILPSVAYYQCEKDTARVAGGKYDLHHPALTNWKGFAILGLI